MAYDIDADKMLEVLRIGKEKLSDKGTTSAKKRVDPIRSQTGMSREAVIEAMLDVFRKKTALQPRTLETPTLKQAEKLARDRFLSNDWTQLVP
jgi:lipoate-protein ligase A